MRSLNNLYFRSSVGPFSFHLAFMSPIVISLERSSNLWSLNKRYAEDAELVEVVTFLLKVGSVSLSVTLKLVYFLQTQCHGLVQLLVNSDSTLQTYVVTLDCEIGIYVYCGCL